LVRTNQNKKGGDDEKQTKKEGMFNNLLNKLIKLPHLKILELSISFLKGFQVKIELFETKEN
jgi:hypothetical protein